MSRRPPPPPPECANCGASLPRSAKSCPECGADERTGWRDTDIYDGLDLPAEAWDDEPAPERVRSANRDVGGVRWYWWATAVFLLLALGLTFLGLR